MAGLEDLDHCVLVDKWGLTCHCFCFSPLKIGWRGEGVSFLKCALCVCLVMTSHLPIQLSSYFILT